MDSLGKSSPGRGWCKGPAAGRVGVLSLRSRLDVIVGSRVSEREGGEVGGVMEPWSV